MDWLDQYLYALSDSKKVEFPPDTHIWPKPVLATQNKKHLFEQIALSEQEKRMMVIAEARREEERQGMGPSLGIGADPGSPAVQSSDSGAWLTRKIYTEFLGGYGVPNPTYTQLSDAIATWTPVLIDSPTNYVFADFPLGTWEFTGYFVAPETGVYSFSSSVDDYAFISYGASYVSNTAHIILQAGEAVPLRILAANVAGPGVLTLLWNNNASQTSTTSNFDGLVYSQLPAGTPVVNPIVPCTDITALVWINGSNAVWPVELGPRTLARVGDRHYVYIGGAEVIKHDGTAWEYYYVQSGEKTVIESVVGDQPWPWLVPWVDFTAKKVCYLAYNGGATYNIGDKVSHGGYDWECVAVAGAGYGPFGGFLDGSANGTIYWIPA